MQKKCLTNIQDIYDNQSFKRCLVRYLYTADYHPARIREVGKLHGDKLDFKHIKFLIKIRDIHKIEKKTSIGISVFVYENNKKYLIYVSRNTFKTHVDL